MNWLIETQDFTPESIADNGNRFLLGNGYMGVRGTLDEHRKEQLAAVNLAGIFDKVGDGWREPLNAPNPFYTTVIADGKTMALPDVTPLSHRQSLDFYSGVMSRETEFQLSDNGILSIKSQRFASMENRHLLGLKFTVACSKATKIKLFAGIDSDVWDIHGPHYAIIESRELTDGTLCLGTTADRKKSVAVSRRNHIKLPENSYVEMLDGGQIFETTLPAGSELVMTSMSFVYTTRDGEDPAHMAAAAKAGSYEAELEASAKAWEAIWQGSQVEIDGDEKAEMAINYSLYHLNAIAPREGEAMSIAARGLSGQTYKGAVFWDTEMFILDYFLATQPDVAKRLLRYRIDTLPGAREKAVEYGWKGAFYAWESQEGGFDACSDYNVTDVFTGRPVRTYFRDKQVHISAAVVWGIARYVEYTGDGLLLEEGGYETVLECARFYHSLLLEPMNSDRYEIHDVIGPDEYHERVNNNAYTNRMAKFVFDTALSFGKRLGDRNRFLDELRLAEKKLYIPRPDPNGLVEQFDGYFGLEDASIATLRSRLKDEREYWGGGNGVASDTQVIKQADVVTMLEMFHREYTEDVLKNNWVYYEPRTEHGSSLSACMYALLACRFGEADLAYPFFLKSATAEINGGGKQWAGLVYIGGTHPAAAGGAWKTLAQGFAGLEMDGDGELRLKPCLPSHWKSLKFRILHRGQKYLASIDGSTAELTPI